MNCKTSPCVWPPRLRNRRSMCVPARLGWLRCRFSVRAPGLRKTPFSHGVLAAVLFCLACLRQAMALPTSQLVFPNQQVTKPGLADAHRSPGRKFRSLRHSAPRSAGDMGNAMSPGISESKTAAPWSIDALAAQVEWVAAQTRPLLMIENGSLTRARNSHQPTPKTF